MADSPELNLWVVLHRPEHPKGDWAAHCLEIDVVSQGRSPRHAIGMVAEAIVMTLKADITAKLLPSRRRAPDQFWDELWGILRNSEPTSLAKGPGGAVALAGQLVLRLETKARRKPAPRPWELPALFASKTRDAHP